MNVIIVEDEGIMALFLEETLQELNYNVLKSFSEASSFYDYLKENSDSVDIVLMDILIKGSIDGIEAARYLKSNYPNILFVFVTSYKDSETIKSATDVNPHGYLIKPINKSDLESTLMVVRNFKKNSKKKEKEQTIVNISSYLYNKKDKTIFYENKMVKLSLKERICLHTLILNKNNYVSTENLIANVWIGEDNNGNNSLRELIYRIRKKLPDLNIKSSQNIGYILEL